MSMKKLRTQSKKKGFALLVAILISSVVLAIGLSMLNITLKQYVFSGIGRESEIAFYATDAGMECVLYWDTSLPPQGGILDIGDTTNALDCMGVSATLDKGNSVIDSGEEITAEFDWQNNGQNVCTKIYLTKYFDATNPVPMGVPGPSGLISCPANATCTRLEARGYNRGCNDLTSPRVVERALRATY